jgi:hypothetical protein
MTTTINTHSLLVQYLPTISPFGIDGNTSTQMPSDSTLLLYSFDYAPEAYPFSPFDINVKEETFFL